MRRLPAPSLTGRPTLVIGELNVDLIAAGLQRLPKLGEEVEAQSFDIVLGSASAIFASGLARLGHPVSFVSKVGNDFFGQLCRRELEARGIETSCVKSSTKTATGVTVCISTLKDRAQVTYPGAIAELSLKDIPASVFDGFAHLHLSCFSLQKRLKPDFGKLFAMAKRRGLSTSFDPNSTLVGETKKLALQALKHVDVLFLNQTEAAQLTGKASAALGARQLSKLVPCVVVKLGSKGALVGRDGQIETVPGYRVRSVDTTGAGDSFAAGFIAGMLAGQSDSDCLRTGNACGALSTRAVGGTGAQPTQEELRRFLVGGSPKALKEPR